MSTREGGVSLGPYASLNLGSAVGDDAAAVAENRRRFAAATGAEPVWMTQVHGTRVIRLGHDQDLVADAAWTDEPGRACTVQVADCLPVLLARRDGRAVGAAHAGWRGALDGVVQSAVDTMVSLGADPSDMVAAVGPCIGPQSYEVGLEFLQRFEADAPGSGVFFRPGAADDKRLFDLPAFVLERLRAAGVERREWVECDTRVDEARFFSNRRAFLRGENDYGRLLSAITLV